MEVFKMAYKISDECISCGACTQICPQKIDIPKVLSDFSELLTTIPSWKKICAERAEAAKKIAGNSEK